jgi:replicative DNA helicase
MTLPAPPPEERELLGLLLRDARNVELVAPRIAATDFAGLREQALYRGCLKVLENGDPLAPRAILAACPKGYGVSLDYLADLLMNAPIGGALDWYTDRVIEAACRRRLGDVGARLRELSANHEVPLGELRDRGETLLHEAMAVEEASEPGPVWKELLAQAETVDQRKGRKDRTIPTGLPWLDRMTGGWKRGQFVIIGACTSVGKTVLGFQLARHAAKQSKKARYVLLEMKAEQMRDRLLSAEAQVDLNKLESGELSATEWERIATTIGEMQGHQPHLVIDDRVPVTLALIRDRCRKAKRTDGLDLVVVDYIGQVSEGRTGMSRYEHISAVARGLKQLAMELDITVIGLSQLNRQVGDQRPGLHNLRESGDLEHEADVVLLLHRSEPAQSNGNVPPGYIQPEYLELGVAKQRQGPRGWKKMRFVGEHVTVREIVVPIP